MKFLFDFLVPGNMYSMLLHNCANQFYQVFVFQSCAMVWFYELTYREKKFTAICALHRNELHTGIFNSGYLLSGTCRQKLSVFLHFGQFYFYSRQVCNKRFITDTLTLNGFTRNAKHGFNFWKWSNLAWNSSSSFTIYFSYSSTLWSAIVSSRKTLVLIPTLGN